MVTMKMLGAISAAYVMSASLGMANTVELACLTKNPSSKDWVPEAVFISVNVDAVRASVLDEFTLAVMEGPALAEVERPTAKRLQIKWSLIGAPDRNGRKANVDFRMTVNLAKMTFNYSGVTESSFVTPGAAAGQCAAVKK